MGPQKGVAFTCYLSLTDRSNRPQFFANPTLDAADFRVSLDDADLVPLTNIPTNAPAGSKIVKLTFTASEMDHDFINVIGSDASQDQWDDFLLCIDTETQTLSTVGAAVWDEPRTGHTEVGSFGAGVPSSSLANGSITENTIADNAITDAKIKVPDIDSGLATRILGMIQQTWRDVFKKSKLTKLTSTTGKKETFDNDNTTALTIQDVSDDGTVEQISEAREPP